MSLFRILRYKAALRPAIPPIRTSISSSSILPKPNTQESTAKPDSFIPRYYPHSVNHPITVPSTLLRKLKAQRQAYSNSALETSPNDIIRLKLAFSLASTYIELKDVKMATKIAHDAILAAIEDTSRDKEFGDAMDESGVFERDDYDTTKLDKMFEWNYRLSALQYLYESLLPSADLGGKVLRDWEQKQDGERKQC